MVSDSMNQATHIYLPSFTEGVDYSLLTRQNVTFNRGCSTGDTECVNITVLYDDSKGKVSKTFDIGLSPVSTDISVRLVRSRATVQIICKRHSGGFTRVVILVSLK